MARKASGKPPGRPRKSPGIAGVIPKLTKRQWRALKWELSRFPNLEEVTWADLANRKLFGRRDRHLRLSVRVLGRRLHVSHNLVHKWRKDTAYWHGFLWVFGRAIAQKLPRRALRRPITQRTKGEADTALYYSLVKPPDQKGEADTALVKPADQIRSPLDGKLYSHAEYLKHIREHKSALWHGDKPDSWFTLK